MLLRDLQAERGLSNEEVASILAEQGVTLRRGPNKGEPITAEAISKRGSSDIPKPWRQALGVTEDSAVSSGDDGSGGDGSGGRRRRETSPARPAGAAIVIEAGAKDRIAGAYRFVGGMLGTGVAQTRGLQTGNGVAAVWTDSADKIAECWIKAAETNAWAARFVNAMSAGGPMGDLAGVHLYLAGGTAYVLGAGLPDAVFAKYSRYRTVEHDTSRNGSERPAEASVEPAPDPVG